jgi:hypothetical protein
MLHVLFGWEPIGNPSWVLGTSSYPVRQPNWEDLPIWAGYPKPSLGSHYPKCSLIRFVMERVYTAIIDQEILVFPAKKISNPSILSNLSNLSILLSIQRIFCNYLSSPSSFRVISPSLYSRLKPTGRYLSSSPISQLSSPEDGDWLVLY